MSGMSLTMTIIAVLLGFLVGFVVMLVILINRTREKIRRSEDPFWFNWQRTVAVSALRKRAQRTADPLERAEYEMTADHYERLGEQR